MIKCANCGHENLDDATSCGICGQSALSAGDVQGIPSPGLDDPNSTVPGDRRLVTVLFADLSGFTELTENADPEDIKEIIGRVLGGATAVVEKYGGVVDKYIGDAIMAVFGFPEIHEDDALRAIRAAREIRTRVAELKHNLSFGITKPLSMHAGINTGLVVTGAANKDKGIIGLVGDSVNLASRLCTLAGEGEMAAFLDWYEPVFLDHVAPEAQPS